MSWHCWKTKCRFSSLMNVPAFKLLLERQQKLRELEEKYVRLKGSGERGERRLEGGTRKGKKGGIKGEVGARVCKVRERVRSRDKALERIMRRGRGRAICGEEEGKAYPSLYCLKKPLPRQVRYKHESALFSVFNLHAQCIQPSSFDNSGIA